MKLILLLLSVSLLTKSIAQTEEVWDTYIAQHNGLPGSTMLDMSLVNSAPVKDLAYLHVTGVTFKDGTVDGFPSKKELDNLYMLEEAVISLVKKNKINKHVGTFTHHLRRVNFFYLRDTIGLRTLLTSFYKTRFPSYLPTITIKADKQWTTYLTFLYPSNEIKEDMSNTKVVLQLTQGGDALEKPRRVDHWLYFKTAADRTSFIAYSKKNMFVVESTELIKDAPLKYQLKVSRIDKVDLASIDKITIALSNESKRLGGSYDGWETSVVK